MKEELQQFRCMSCNALLLFHKVKSGTLEIQCRKSSCKAINILDMDKINDILKKEN